MLQLTDDRIVEQYNFNSNSGSCIPYNDQCYLPQQTVYWNNYPVYIYQDKTKKAIKILKLLQNEKLVDCKSINKFIELVDKISNLL